jgi:hypothetical protein
MINNKTRQQHQQQANTTYIKFLQHNKLKVLFTFIATVVIYCKTRPVYQQRIDYFARNRLKSLNNE